MQINTSNTIYILGNVQNCYCIGDKMPHMLLRMPWQSIKEELKQDGFMQINDFTLINTKFIIHIKPGRIIILKGGSIHKVSRKFWKHFRECPLVDKWR
ncbi:LytTR family DNA-binding domain-containing protein [Carboxylicivirga sp. RSCT41]|uniref:LytTR family DNA-binding domain-containing protein n=1 Tax=Carboxylicivirga agarovorans TaxID=3417570 RepID=UPI003D335629